MYKMFICVVMLGVSINAWAARGFFIENAEVVSVAVLYDGDNHVIQLSFRAEPADVNQGAITCAPTWVANQTTANDIKVVTWWNSSSTPNSTVQGYYSTALAAYAQNKRVDISVNTSTCSATGRAYGHMLSGVRISIPN